MTVKEAILTLNANAVIACERAEFDSATVKLVEDALDTINDALKEQEAVEPIKMQRMDNNFSFLVPYFLCGNCRYELVGKDVMFCSHCGKAVTWNG